MGSRYKRSAAFLMALCMMVSLLQGWPALATESAPDRENVYIADELPQEAEPAVDTEPVEDAEAVEGEEEFATLFAVSATYLDASGATQTAKNVTEVKENDTAWTDGNWYVVNSNVSNGNRIEVKGDVHLILADGFTLNASKGITVLGSDSLTIYGQSAGTGKLSATGGTYQAGIGGDYADAGDFFSSNLIGGGGAITIYGGKVEANGVVYGAGIGGGSQGAGGKITINGGAVEATGGISAAGIGGGNEGASGAISITGGTVTATVPNGTKGAAIGNGGGGTNVDVTIGEDLTVKAGNNAASAMVVTDFASNHTQKYARIAVSTPWQKLQALMAEGGEITLPEDVTAEAGDTPLAVPTDKAVTLDLNGHTIDRALTAETANGNVIMVNVKGALTVTDSSATAEAVRSGKITGGNNTGNGGGVFINYEATFAMNGGEISGNSAKSGSGVYASGSGNNFNLTDVTVSGNSAKSGGGVFANSSSAGTEINF